MLSRYYASVESLLIKVFLLYIFCDNVVDMLFGNTNFYVCYVSYLVAAASLQCLWSFSLAIVDIYALLVRRSLQNHQVIGLFTVGDGVRFQRANNSSEGEILVLIHIWILPFVSSPMGFGQLFLHYR